MTTKETHTHTLKLRSLQAFRYTLQGDAVASEGQHRAVGTSVFEEVRFSCLSHVITWMEGEKEREQGIMKILKSPFLVIYSTVQRFVVPVLLRLGGSCVYLLGTTVSEMALSVRMVLAAEY